MIDMNELEKEKIMNAIEFCNSVNNNCDYLLEHNDCDSLTEIFREYRKSKVNNQQSSGDNYLDKHKELCDRIHETCVKKNHDYGNSASRSYQEFGLISYVVRMEDKFNRIKSLMKVKAEVNDESIKDTLLDLANYCLLAVTDIEMESESNVKNKQ